MSLISLKKHLALPQTSWQICLLAAIGGVASALLITLFSISIDALQSLYLQQKEDYTSLSALSRFHLPIIGAILILLSAYVTGYQYLRSGIPFVLHRLKVAHGVIPFRNTLNQFIGSVIALSSGFSVGREGPAVHLGAACSSFIGSYLKLPFNTIRTLCACGIAAGIAASFNTPVAAVIFVMEVILREYKVHIFIPIMIAAIVGSLITEYALGTTHKFAYFGELAVSVSDYGLVVVLGIVLGAIAAAFNRHLTFIIKHANRYHLMLRFLVAALITGILGAAMPYAMGTDLSAISFAIADSASFELLFYLLIAKFFMTIVALGLGVPGGVIGPILSIGAITGIAIVTLSNQIFAQHNLLSDFALLGMAGFMAATLNAPLAALLAVVELSNQLDVMVPAMIVITSACLASGQLFKNRSILVMQLEIQGLLYRQPPIEKSLQSIGAMGVMKENFALLAPQATQFYVNALANADNDQLFIVKDPEKIGSFVWLECQQSLVNENNIQQHQLIAMSSQITLAEAYIALVNQRKGGVYLYDGDDKNNIIGVVLFEQIRRFLIEGKTN
ncbi:chloride channel protein [Thalassotalea ganghwensis]